MAGPPPSDPAIPPLPEAPASENETVSRNKEGREAHEEEFHVAIVTLAQIIQGNEHMRRKCPTKGMPGRFRC